MSGTSRTDNKTETFTVNSNATLDSGRNVRERSGMAGVILHSVFQTFQSAAQKKLKDLLYVNLDRDEDLSRFIAEGHDPNFDSTLTSLALVSKNCPKLFNGTNNRVIDSIMYWRKSKKTDTTGKILFNAK